MLVCLSCKFYFNYKECWMSLGDVLEFIPLLWSKGDCCVLIFVSAKSKPLFADLKILVSPSLPNDFSWDSFGRGKPRRSEATEELVGPTVPGNGEQIWGRKLYLYLTSTSLCRIVKINSTERLVFISLLLIKTTFIEINNNNRSL